MYACITWIVYVDISYEITLYDHPILCYIVSYKSIFCIHIEIRTSMLLYTVCLCGLCVSIDIQHYIVCMSMTRIFQGAMLAWTWSSYIYTSQNTGRGWFFLFFKLAPKHSMFLSGLWCFFYVLFLNDGLPKNKQQEKTSECGNDMTKKSIWIQIALRWRSNGRHVELGFFGQSLPRRPPGEDWRV